MVYITSRIPRWTWIALGIAAVLMLLIVFSVAGSRSEREIVVIGPEVETGNPQDFVEQPPAPPPVTPPPETTPPPTAPPETAPAPAPGPEIEIPAGMPEAFTYNGKMWKISEGSVRVDVLATGQYTDNHVIYRKVGDQPPYDALYIETEPNSGRFYKYVPAG